MDIYSMKCFISIAQTLNLSRAAEEMNVTQPAISAQLKKIESEVGGNLIHRTSHKMELTPLGQMVYNRFKEITALYEDTMWRAKLFNEGKKAIRVGYEGPNDWAGVNRLFMEYMKLYPDVDLQIYEGELGALVDSLEKAEMDVVFVDHFSVSTLEEVESMYLFSDYGCFAMSSDHPLAVKEKLTSEDVKGQQIYLNMAGSASMEQIYRKLLASGVRAQDIHPVRGAKTEMMMAAAHGGLAALPRTFKTKDVGQDLVFRDLDNPVKHIDYVVAWSDKRSTLPIHQLIDLCGKFNWPTYE